jgi:hypothetical protein
VTERQLPLFADISDPRPASDPTDATAAEPPGEAPGTEADDRQLGLFADRAVVWRELEAAITSGRFEDVATLRGRIEEDYGVDSTWRLDLLARLDGVAWDSPQAPLSIWLDVDRQLGARPLLRAQVHTGVFNRLLQLHHPEALLAARPDCLPAIARALRKRPDSLPEDGLRAARSLVRDSLLAGHALEPLDLQDDTPLADLLAEDRDPRWLACLGRIRRLWPSDPPCASEWTSLGQIARGEAPVDHPALAFWDCLRLAERAECPDELRQLARRRMKQLEPELHALFMRRSHG